MYTEPDSIGHSMCETFQARSGKKKILNVHIENWFTMELPSKMNSELESNTPPPKFVNTL